MPEAETIQRYTHKLGKFALTYSNPLLGSKKLSRDFCALKHVIVRTFAYLQSILKFYIGSQTYNTDNKMTKLAFISSRPLVSGFSWTLKKICRSDLS